MRVKIALAVDANGVWYAAGGSTNVDRPECYPGALEDAEGGHLSGDPVTLNWIEVDVPLPAISTLLGTAKEVSSG